MRFLAISVLSALLLLRMVAGAQAPAPPEQTPASAGQTPAPAAQTPSAPGQTPAQGVVLDRLLAVVNQDVILQSDVDEERRLTAFQPFRDVNRNSTFEQIVERLIDRALILQQARLQPEAEITDAQVDEQLNALRKQIPACKQYQCETQAGWLRYIKDQEFTLEELRVEWRQRMEVLRFIEERFRSGISISDDDVKSYYEKTLLPQYARMHASAPPLEAITKRVQEVLLQQQVTNLLADWLKSLRAQGTVRTIQASEGTP